MLNIAAAKTALCPGLVVARRKSQLFGENKQGADVREGAGWRILQSHNYSSVAFVLRQLFKRDALNRPFSQLTFFPSRNNASGKNSVLQESPL